MPSQFCVLRYFQYSRQRAEVITMHCSICHNLAGLVQKLHPALLWSLDLSIPVSDAIQNGRKHYLLARTVYAPVGIYSHPVLLLCRGGIVIVALEIPDFGQATVGTKADAQSLLFLILQHIGLGAWFAGACIHHRNPDLLAWHVNYKGLQSGNDEGDRQFLGFLSQTGFRSASYLHGVPSWLHGGSVLVLAKHLPPLVQYPPLHSAYVGGVNLHAQRVTRIINLCHTYAQPWRGFPNGVIGLLQPVELLLHPGRFPVAMGGIEVYQFLLAHHRVLRAPIVCGTPHHIEHIAAIHLLVLASLHNGQPVLGAGIIEQFGFCKCLAEEFQTSLPPLAGSIGIGTHGIQLCQCRSVNGTAHAGLSGTFLFQKLQVILYAVGRHHLPLQTFLQYPGQLVLTGITHYGEHKHKDNKQLPEHIDNR